MSEPIRSIAYPITIDQGLGSLLEETDYSKHVRQMMLQVLFTNPGERINLPDFGCGLRRMVFAPNSVASANLLKVLITKSLTKYLGTLITLQTVDVGAVDSTLSVSIAYILKARQEKLYLNLEVSL
jgi:phage baseplate assembly protein W